MVQFVKICAKKVWTKNVVPKKIGTFSDSAKPSYTISVWNNSIGSQNRAKLIYLMHNIYACYEACIVSILHFVLILEDISKLSVQFSKSSYNYETVATGLRIFSTLGYSKISVDLAF